jgi:hypothetical protein
MTQVMDIQRGSFDPYRSAHEASDLRPPEHYRHRKLMELALPTLAKPLSEVRPEVPTNPETGRTIRMFVRAVDRVEQRRISMRSSSPGSRRQKLEHRNVAWIRQRSRRLEGHRPIERRRCRWPHSPSTSLLVKSATGAPALQCFAKSGSRSSR